MKNGRLPWPPFAMLRDRRRAGSLVPSPAILLLAALLALAVPLPARADGFYVTLGATNFPGTVQSIGPQGAWITTLQGPVLVPVNVASFRVGGMQVSWQQLVPGQPVMVYYPSTPGYVVGMQDQCLQFQSQWGVPMYVPMTALPHGFAYQQVYVRTMNGGVMQVPMQSALRMQTYQGAVILGSRPYPRPHGYAVPAVYPGGYRGSCPVPPSHGHGGHHRGPRPYYY